MIFKTDWSIHCFTPKWKKILLNLTHTPSNGIVVGFFLLVFNVTNECFLSAFSFVVICFIKHILLRRWMNGTICGCEFLWYLVLSHAYTNVKQQIFICIWIKWTIQFSYCCASIPHSFDVLFIPAKLWQIWQVQMPNESMSCRMRARVIKRSETKTVLCIWSERLDKVDGSEQRERWRFADKDYNICLRQYILWALWVHMYYMVEIRKIMSDFLWYIWKVKPDRFRVL